MANEKSLITSTTGTSTLVKPRFGPGMLLQHEDLDQLATYTQDLNRLLFRSLFGCGVVCGLEVSALERCDQLHVTVQRGVALACSGDPIHLPRAQTLVVDKNTKDENQPYPSELWVVLYATSKRCAPRTSMCAADDDDAPSLWTRERVGFEIRLFGEPPTGICGNPARPPQPAVPVDAPAREGTAAPAATHDCKCADPGNALYEAHYLGRCCDHETCGCGGVLLAYLKLKDGEPRSWDPYYSGRRFVRPVLVRDPRLDSSEQRDGAEGASTRHLTAAAPGGTPATADASASAARNPGRRHRN